MATDKTAVLVDCGAAARDVTERLRSIGYEPEQIQGILISHAHCDHYRSAGTMHARFGIPVYVDPSTARALHRKGSSTSWKRIEQTSPIPERIGDLGIEALDTSHGHADTDGRTLAFCLRNGSKRIGVVTDLGMVTEEIAASLKGIDALVFESNYDEETIRRKLSDRTFARDWDYLRWVEGDRGHLSNRQCAEALTTILRDKNAHVFLGHLSENHKHPSMDNNSYQLALDTMTEIFAREHLPVPEVHRTYRIGRDPGSISDLIELG